jgi:hypothetical protein
VSVRSVVGLEHAAERAARAASVAVAGLPQSLLDLLVAASPGVLERRHAGAVGEIDVRPCVDQLADDPRYGFPAVADAAW